MTSDNAKAATALAIVTQTHTDDPVNFFYLAAAHQKLKDNDKAVDALTAGLRLHPKDANMLDLLTRLLLDRALASKSPSDFQAAIARGEQLRLTPTSRVGTAPRSGGSRGATLQASVTKGAWSRPCGRRSECSIRALALALEQ